MASPRPLTRWMVRACLAAPVACGAAGGAHLNAEPSPTEQTLFAGEGSPGVRRMPPLEAALVVGGATTPAELATLSRTLDAALGEVVASLPADAPNADPTRRPRALLEALFARRASGAPLLRAYDASATTLYDVETTGRFNCVSATILYLLGAHKAGIEARAVLLPSHARGLVVARGKRYVVETTTPQGFDPPAWVSRDALDRARPKELGPHVDLYADERGTEVDDDALLGIAYGNLGIMAQARGDTALAAALLAREAKLTPPAQLPLVRAQQVSLLTELATAALRGQKFSDAMKLARQADDAAPDPRMKRLTDQNVAAIGSQELTVEGPAMNDAALMAFPDSLKSYPSAYGDVRALALTLLASRKLSRGDVDGSATALREAAGVATSSDVKGQTDHNARLGELNRLGKLSMTDPESAWAGWQKLGPSDPSLASMESDVLKVISQNRAVRLANDGRCAELDAALAAGPVPNALPLRASCHARRGVALSERGDGASALSDLRAAVKLDPSDTHHKQNLVAVLEKQIDTLAHSGRCKETRPLVAEGKSVDPGATFWAEVELYCKSQP